MLRIYFKKSEKASLPEIEAYMDYFLKNGHKVYSGIEDVAIFEKIHNITIDVVWEIKGFLGETVDANQLLVHDYPSLSTGKLPHLKNLLKKQLNRKPDLRLFLNDRVKEEFNFSDNVPYLFRDMGIHRNFVQFDKNLPIKYDFLYVGVVDKSRGIDQMLNLFLQDTAHKNHNICLVGAYSEDIFVQFHEYPNIIFKGQVPYEEVPNYIYQSKVCINYIPDVYPYNIQTSTKLLEYLAMSKAVLTTNYMWVEEFEQKNNINLAKIEKTGFSLKEIEKETNITSFSVETYTWEKIFERINLNDVIIDLYNRKMRINDQND